MTDAPSEPSRPADGPAPEPAAPPTMPMPTASHPGGEAATSEVPAAPVAPSAAAPDAASAAAPTASPTPAAGVPQPLAGTSRPPGLSSTPPAPPPQRTAWGARLAVLGLALVAAVAGWFAATRFLPRWWAHRVGDVADGTFTAGVFAGLTCGVVFTFLPLLVLRGVVRRGRSWPTRFVLLVLAFMVSVPNLITLFVVLGTNNAAHAAERTFDVEAPGFRGATLVGAVLGALLAVGFWVLTGMWRRGRRRIGDLEARLAEREAAVKSGAEDAEKQD